MTATVNVLAIGDLTTSGYTGIALLGLSVVCMIGAAAVGGDDVSDEGLVLLGAPIVGCFIAGGVLRGLNLAKPPAHVQCARNSGVKLSIIESAAHMPDEAVLDVPWDSYEKWSYSDARAVGCGQHVASKTTRADSSGSTLETDSGHYRGNSATPPHAPHKRTAGRDRTPGGPTGEIP